MSRILIKRGSEVDFSTMKTGKTQDGRTWGYYKATDPSRPDIKKTMIVFIENIEDAQYYTGKGRVSEIVSVEQKPSKDKYTDKWEDKMTVTVIVDGVNPMKASNEAAATSFENALTGFMDTSGEGDLPFK